MDNVNDDQDQKICPVLLKLPTKLRDRLMPFQKAGVQYAVNKNGRCLIADEMGLGKTLQAISVACCYKDEWPLLIIVPSSLKFCWIEELEKWLPDILPHEINLVQTGSDVSGMASCPITIVTYGLLRLPSSKLIIEAINARRFQVVICDESHYLKNTNTLSCKTVVPILKAAHRRILLSGTPALAKPVELYPQIDAICPGQFGSFWQYTDKYCDAHYLYLGKFKKRQVGGASNLEDLQQKLTSMLMIRREKSDVLTELPPKQRQRILFELKNSSLKKEIFDTFAELKQKIQKGNGTIQNVLHSDEMSNLPEVELASRDTSSGGVHGLISRLYKLSGEAKIGPVREYIEMLCEDEQLKFLVFAYHHDMMDGIQQTLWDKKVKFVRIDGKTRSSDRQAYVNQFQSDPDTRVAILSILAAGVGLTLTAAKLVVFSELYWTPGTMVQCEDRAHRIGQTSSLPVHYLVARDTMDEWVWSAVCRKTLVTSTALDGKTRQLNHSEGSSHQIDLLSNADVWKQEGDNCGGDVTQLVQSQRADDQSSILEFFKSQSSPSNTPTFKRKHEMVPGGARSAVSVFAGETLSSLKGKSCQESREKMPDLEKVKSNHVACDIVIVSDDEDEFKPSKKAKQADSRQTKHSALKQGRKMKHRKQKKDGRSDVTSSEKINIDVSCERNINEMRSSNTEAGCGGGAEASSQIVTERLVQDQVINSCLEHQLKDVSSESGLYSSDVDDLLTESVSGKGSNLGHKKRVRSNIDQCVSTHSTVYHLQDSHNLSREDSFLYGSTEPQKVEPVSDEWSCGLCTFSNHSELPHCEMCDTPKKKSTSMNQQNMLREFPHTGIDCPESLPHIATTSETSQSEACPSSDTTSRSSDYTIDQRNLSRETKQVQSQFTSLLARNSSRICGTFNNRRQILSDVGIESSDRHCTVSDTRIGDSNNPSSKTGLRNVTPNQSTTDSRNVPSNRSAAQQRNVPSNRSTAHQRTLFPPTDLATEQSYDSSGISDQDFQEQMHISNDDDDEQPFLTAQFPVVEDSRSEMDDLGSDYLCFTNQSVPVLQTSDVSVSSPGDSSALLSASLSSLASFPVPKLSADDSCSDTDLQSTIRTGGKPSSSTVSGTPQQQNLRPTDRTGQHALKFSCSVHTGRIYVYNENEDFLQASFHPIDIEMGSIADLPEVIQQPGNLRLVQKFVREWSSLTETKRRLIAKRCQVFTSPLSAYGQVRTVHGSKQRYLTKQDSLDTALKGVAKFQSSVQLISKKLRTTPVHLDSESADIETAPIRGVAQVVTVDGVPVCLHCQTPFHNTLLSPQTISDPKNAWQLRLCSYTCMDQYWTLRKAGYCRDQIYDIEHGVCRLCRYDTHTLFIRVRATKNMKARADLINKSPFRTLSVRQRGKMVEIPQAGQFWHVDHITPVWQGGGLCDLDNLRTLCTPCHHKVTCRQAGQRATIKKLSAAAGQADITAFFQRT